jgi:hypothetical protein
MLLIIFLGLIVKLSLGSEKCELGPPKLNDFDMNKVGIIVWHAFYKTNFFETSAWFYISFMVTLTYPQYSISDCTFE